MALQLCWMWWDNSVRGNNSTARGWEKKGVYQRGEQDKADMRAPQLQDDVSKSCAMPDQNRGGLGWRGYFVQFWYFNGVGYLVLQLKVENKLILIYEGWNMDFSHLIKSSCVVKFLNIDG